MKNLAASYLTEAGLVVVDRNWRCSEGELDIVATDGSALVFCEVKTRSSMIFGGPAEAVTPLKAARIWRLALRWLIENRDGSSEYWPILRFDVVCVLRRRDQPPIIDHLREAF